MSAASPVAYAAAGNTPSYASSAPPQNSRSASASSAPPPSQVANGVRPSASSETPVPVPQQPPPVQTVDTPKRNQQNGIKSPSQSGPAKVATVEHTEQYVEFSQAIKTAPPTIVRQALRDNWEKCLVGSDFHSAFVLNTVLRKAAKGVVSHIAKEFAATITDAGGPDFIKHLTAESFDRHSDAVLSRLSNKFLDEALARRLETIDAQPLVNALARAERLGYDVQDIVEERSVDGPEHVIPALPPGQLPWSMPPQQSQSMPPMQGMPPPPDHYYPQNQPPPTNGSRPRSEEEGTPDGIRFCHKCKRPCSGEKALANHLKKEACNPTFKISQLSKTICFHCGVSFGSNGGVVYHIKTKVCGDYTLDTVRQMNQLVVQYCQQNEGRGQPQAQLQTPQQPPPQPNKSSVSTEKPRYSVANLDGTYAHLTPERNREFQDAVAKTEARFGPQFREAQALPEPERSDQITRLKNRYQTKLSTTRKRFGIRLTQKRDQREVDAERARLFGTTNGTNAWLAAAQPVTKRPLDSEGTPMASTPSKKARTEGGPPVSSTPSQPPAPPAESPRKRVPLHEMGGLTGSSASAETMDPTAYVTASQPRGLAQMQHARATNLPQTVSTSNGTGHTEVVPISDDSDGESESDTDDSSESDDDDIPA